MLLANHGALTVGGDLFGAYYKMETIEHFAKISLVARMLGRENLLSREEVIRLQERRRRSAPRPGRMPTRGRPSMHRVRRCRRPRAPARGSCQTTPARRSRRRGRKKFG